MHMMIEPIVYYYLHITLLLQVYNTINLTLFLQSIVSFIVVLEQSLHVKRAFKMDNLKANILSPMAFWK